jgi:uncharacterized hydrophobic protein (TIGR00271 family)
MSGLPGPGGGADGQLAPVARPLFVISSADVARMRGQLFFDGADAIHKLSRFWVLLVLSAVIASAGIVSDSTATVIGAMIVAPLMTPILGTVLSVVTGDRANLARSLGLVLGGAVTVIVIGWLFGLLIPVGVVAATNAQVAGRVDPQLIDLIAALATGAVGSFALVRSDVSDTLPGVAIAISLVPPLAVVGLTLESGAAHQSLGALLLFLTNVGAILLSGLVVMALYRVHKASAVAAAHTGVHRRSAAFVVVAFVVILTVPLAVSTVRVSTDAVDRANVAPVAQRWADAAGWKVTSITTDDVGVDINASGGLPAPDPKALRRQLDAAGLAHLTVVVELTPTARILLPAN